MFTRFLFFCTSTAAASASLSWLLDATVKSIVAVSIAGVAALTAHRQASAATRHFLWLLAIAASLALPILSFVLPAWRILPSWSQLRPQSTSAPGAPVAIHSFVIAPAVNVRTSRTSTAPAPLSTLPLDEAASALRWPLLSWLWAAGCALLLVRLSVAHFFLHRMIKRCAPDIDDLILEELQRAQAQLDVRRPITLLRDPRLAIPFVFGLFRPRLVLPMESEQWSRIEVRSVLLHELAHIKRHDVAIQWLTQIACALHWFNPLIWFAAWRLRLERERACDDLVVASGVRAADYAEHLLHVATKLETPLPTFSCGAALAMARPSRLEGRLVALLNGRTNHDGVTRALAVGAIGVAVALIVPMAMLRAADEKPESAPPGTSNDAAPQPRDDSERREKNDGQTNSGQTQDHEDSRVAAETSAALRQQADQDIMKLRAQLDELRQQFNDAHPKVKEVRARLAELEAERNLRSGNDPFAAPNDPSGSAERALALLRLQQAQLEYRRANELHNQKMISAAERDKAKATVDLRRAELAGDQSEVARVELAQAEAQLARLLELRGQKVVSETECEQAKLAVEAARIRLQQRELEAAQAKQLSQKPIRTVDKVPVLGDLPFLGRLFRKSGSSELAEGEPTAEAAPAGAAGVTAGTAEDRPAQRAQSAMRVVALKYTDAATVSPLVEKAMAAQKQMVHVLSDARTNSLVIVANDAGIEAAVRFIALLDKSSGNEASPADLDAARSGKNPKATQQAVEAQQQLVESTRLRLQQAEEELKRLKALHEAQGDRL
jgi:beta-lactamase regulating signal transducer with metallopeptidase domain/multidrug resistance efflux pump